MRPVCRVPFQENDWVVSDVAQSADGALFAVATSPGDRQPKRKQWAWKQLNKTYQGQTLITRTIDDSTFMQTYQAVNLANDGTLPLSSFD